MAKSGGWFSRLFSGAPATNVVESEIPDHMKVILALGNPGARYELTRHNIGWLVADAIARRLRADFRPAKGEYYEAKGEWRGTGVLLVKPTTYMNNSGLAARQLIERLGISPADILVVVDEIQFPVGRSQLKPSGSSGGHNGVESIIQHLGTKDFPRLRCGVGKDFGPGEMVEYVLAPFPEREREEVGRMIDEAADTALLWAVEGTARAMTSANTRGETKRTPDGGSQPESGKEKAE